LKDILIRYDVQIADTKDLLVLQNYDIVVIADDSGSMKRRTDLGTRWSELKDTLGLLIEIAVCFDADGIDVYFLNRDDIKGVRSARDPRLESAFARGPSGRTPLAETINRMLREQSFTKPLLILVATDGLPDGSLWDSGVRRVEKEIRNSINDPRKRVHYQMLPCSDKDEDIAWMNDLDEKFKEVDTTDDYETEKAEVLRVGLARKFDRSDWIMKALLGPVSKKYDAWDIGAHRTVKGSSNSEDTEDGLCQTGCCVS
jgi:hypothetical protein